MCLSPYRPRSPYNPIQMTPFSIGRDHAVDGRVHGGAQGGLAVSNRRPAEHLTLADAVAHLHQRFAPHADVLLQLDAHLGGGQQLVAERPDVAESGANPAWQSAAAWGPCDWPCASRDAAAMNGGSSQRCFSAIRRRLFCVHTFFGSRSSGQEYRLHRLHSQQNCVPATFASPTRLNSRLRIARCGSIGWPSNQRGQSSVQKLH